MTANDYHQGATRPILSARHIGTAYGDLQVVRDVSLDVWAGQITVLLGRNGAGKTSALRAITGLNRLTDGVLTMNGTDISAEPAHVRVHHGMAFVQEGKRVFRRLTCEQNLLLGGYSTGRSRRQLRQDVDRIYSSFPVLGDKRGLPAASLSGGQQQMLAIGQALMAQPQLLILDEPSGGLAPVVVKEVMERVDQLRATGIGILLVEQAVDAALAVADHVVVIELGRIVLSDRAGELDPAELREAYFGRGAHVADAAFTTPAAGRTPHASRERTQS